MDGSAANLGRRIAMPRYALKLGNAIKKSDATTDTVN